MNAATMTSPGDVGTVQRPSRFRPDVEALRALAIALVVLYHAGVPGIPGGFVGVDIFFVISGFLITGLLVRELEGSRRIRFGHFYARRFRRLVPAAVTVLAFSAAVTQFLSPSAYRHTYGIDISSAAAYVANWNFAAHAVNYLDSELPASPVEHFWSLSVEEQFYVLWPVLLALVAVGVRRWAWRVRPAIAITLGAVAVLSLIRCVTATSANQPFAFFATGVRMWELALGGLVAIGMPLWSRMVVRLRGVLVGAGLALIALAALRVTADMAWPGTLALVPTLGTVLVIVAGSSGSAAPRMNGAWWRPVLWLGGLSYSLYLWHWPVLIAAREIWGRGTLGRGLLAIGVACVLAWLSQRFIENPVRYAPALTGSVRRSIVVGLVLSAFGVALGALVALSNPAAPATPGLQVNLDTPGAPAVIDLAKVDPAAPNGAALLWPDPVRRWSLISPSGEFPPVPDPRVAIDDRPKTTDPDCHLIIEFNEVTPRWCFAGDTNASRRIVVVGDSKTTQWYTALNAYGMAHGWRVEFTAKASCPFSESTLVLKNGPYSACDTWNSTVLEGLDADPPDVVITSSIYGVASALGSSADVKSTHSAAVAGYSKRWSHLEAEGVHVIVLADNPRPSSDIDDCVAHHVNDPDECALNRRSAVRSSGGPALLEAAAKTPGVDFIDFTDYFCNANTCPAVIGNVVVYRGGYHLTDSYVRTLAPFLDWQLQQFLEPSAPTSIEP